MLRELKASDPRFRAISFGPGLNLLVADRTTTSTDDQSRNAVGKTSMVELLHFLLGADKTPLVTREENKSTMFELVLDWSKPGEQLSVRRSGSAPRKIHLDPDILGHDPEALFPRAGETGVKEWRNVLERGLFGIRDPGKTLRMCFMREADLARR